MQLNKIISVCAPKDIDVWKIASRKIIKYINSEKYIVIVPDDEIKLFKINSPNNYLILPETDFAPDTKNKILEKFNGEKSSLGWYLQQIIKLSALKDMRDDELSAIWDADTVPLKRINFTYKDKINFYKGFEYHKPYFDSIKGLTGLEKSNNFSFIAQCLPCKGEWSRSFFRHIEKTSGKKWDDAVIDSIDINCKSSFSEFETLGTFIYNNFNDQIKILNNKWHRYGNGLIGSVDNLKFINFLLRFRYDFMSFEKWDKPFSRWS